MKKRFLAMGLVFLLLFLSVGPTSIAYNINKKNNSEDLPDIITKISTAIAIMIFMASSKS